MKNEKDISKISFSDRITLFGFILSILVIFIHAKNVEAYNIAEKSGGIAGFVFFFEHLISDNIAKAAVPGFFIMSGFLFYKRFDMSLYKEKMSSRFFSLVIPYFCWNILRLFYAIAINNYIFPGDNHVVICAENILNGIFMYKYNLGYWYMFQLILCVLLCPFVYLLIKNKWAGLISIAAVFTINMLPVIPQKIPYLLPDAFLFYLTGAYVGRHFFGVVKQTPKHPFPWFLLLFVLAEVCIVLFEKTYILHWYLLFAYLMAASIFMLTAVINIKSCPWWMGISFFIYSLHGTLLEISEMLLLHILPRSPAFAIAEYILLTFLVLVLIIVIASVMQKITPHIWNVLSGGRKARKNNANINVQM